MAETIEEVSYNYEDEGKLVRNCKARLIRDGVEIYSGKITSLRRFTEDAREVASGYECGIALERFSDVKRGDIIEPFVREQVAKKLAAQS